MKQSELQQILAEHKLWLEDNSQGKRADLRNADLQNAGLRSADLQNANLQNANLRNADLQNANLQYADLQGADLRGADLRNADLQYADLREAGIYTFQFGKHFAFAHFGEQYESGLLMQIGCHGHSLAPGIHLITG